MASPRGKAHRQHIVLVPTSSLLARNFIFSLDGCLSCFPYFFCEIVQATTQDELDQALESCDSWRFQVGGLPHPVSMDNKDAFVKNAMHFHIFIQQQSCYDQLREGLAHYEVSVQNEFGTKGKA